MAIDVVHYFAPERRNPANRVGDLYEANED